MNFAQWIFWEYIALDQPSMGCHFLTILEKGNDN